MERCSCGKEPEVKELKAVTYVLVCGCGCHGPVMPIREWAVDGWDLKMREPNLKAKEMSLKVREQKLVHKAVGDATAHKR